MLLSSPLSLRIFLHHPLPLWLFSHFLLGVAGVSWLAEETQPLYLCPFFTLLEVSVQTVTKWHWRWRYAVRRAQWAQKMKKILPWKILLRYAKTRVKTNQSSNQSKQVNVHWSPTICLTLSTGKGNAVTNGPWPLTTCPGTKYQRVTPWKTHCQSQQ